MENLEMSTVGRGVLSISLLSDVFSYLEAASGLYSGGCAVSLLQRTQKAAKILADCQYSGTGEGR